MLLGHSRPFARIQQKSADPDPLKRSNEDRRVIAAAVDAHPLLAGARDHFLESFQDAGGRHMGPAVASILLYEVGHWLSEQDKEFER